MASKWFDYRFIHPTAATQLFAECYENAFRRAWKQSCDMHEAELKRPLPANIFESAVLIDLWQTRQAADRIGTPYDVFCNQAIAWCMDRGYRHVPRPNQLRQMDLLQHVESYWLDYTAVRFQHGTDMRYLTRSWCNHPAQLDHVRWMIEQARKRNHPSLILSEVLYKRPMVPPPLAEKAFAARPDILEAAERERGAPDELPPVEDVDFHYGCFGLPHAYSPTSATCEACPSADECQHETAGALTEIRKCIGTVTPAEDRKRNLAAERQRRKRAKDKAAATPAVPPKG